MQNNSQEGATENKNVETKNSDVKTTIYEASEHLLGLIRGQIWRIKGPLNSWM